MFKLRKVASLLASAAMVGSTAGLAMATTYPAPFVESGAANGIIVYGSHSAAVVDLAAAVDIQTSLNSAVTVTGAPTGTPEGADFVQIAKSSDNLNLGDTWTGVFTGSVDDDDMPNLLADGEYRADDNDEFDYEQKITLGSPTMTHFRDSDYESLVGLDERTPVVGFKFSSNTHVMNYTLEFIDDAQSSVDSSGDLDDFEGSDLPLMGKNYYVSDAKNGSSPTFMGTFTLLDSAVTSVVTDDEVLTVTVDSNAYDVSINFIDTTGVKFDVNGEITNKLSAGQTYKLNDGAYIGAREVNFQNFAGGLSNAEFSIGSGKLEIASGSDVKLNDETIQGVKGYIERGTASTDEKIDKIVIEWTTDEEMFLTPESELTMPGFETFKFTMNELVRPEEEKVVIEKDDDNSVQLIVPIKDGDATFNILYNSATTGNFSGIGKATDERLATTPANSLIFQEKDSSGNDYHEWFVASYATGTEAESYLLRATVSTDSSTGRNRTTVDKMVDGSWAEACKDKIPNDSCEIGQVALTISAVGYTSGAAENVTFTAGSTNVNFSTIYTDGGLKIFLPWVAENSSVSIKGAVNFTGLSSTAGHSAESFYLFMDGEDKDDNLGDGTDFNITLDNTAGSSYPLQVSQVNNAGSGGPSGLELGNTKTYEAYLVDEVAPRILHYTNPDEDWAEVYYPSGDSETYAEVFLTAADAGSGGDSSMNVLVVKDTEASSISGKNVVVVGGSCVNTLAAEVLGVAFPTCGSDWTTATTAGSGQYVIESLTRSGGKVATLVAGYEADDTSNAATYFTTQDVDTTPGMKYVGTTGTQATLVTA